MGKNRVIDYDANSFIVKGKRIILFGGEFHYFRIPHKLWEDRLNKMKQAGANFVSAYIPWNWHEPEEGVYLWEGDHNLSKFLELCKKYGFYVALKPGPYICAEWDNGGFPHWILPKNLKLRLLDEEYLSFVEKWFKEVGRVINPHLITNSGNVILFQIENEYDHLMEQQRDVIITKEEAVEYLMRLLKITKMAGIDIPTFSNEACFIQGTEIIETRTFYPNIPWLWMWEFDDFDKKIRQAKKGQPDKPVCIFELQGGWFSQFGQPIYEVPAALTNAIVRNVLAQNACLLNVFMFAGGTTFPYWGCRGDARGSGNMAAIGSVTSYDFGCSPIREWGELSEKYYDLKSVAMFLKAFPHLFIKTEEIPGGAKIIKGMEGTHILEKDGVISGGSSAQIYEKVMVLEKANEVSGLMLVRNVETSNKHLVISYKIPGTQKERLLPKEGKLSLPHQTAYLLPIEVKIPHSSLIIEHSTSEILTSKKVGKNEILFLYGSKGRKGELIIRGVKRFPRKIKGKIKCKQKEDVIYLSYIHQGVQMVSLEGVIVVILDVEKARGAWLSPEESILITDAYCLSNSHKFKKDINLYLQVLNGKTNNNLIFLEKRPNKLLIDGKKIPFKWDKDFSYLSFVIKSRKEEPVKIEKDKFCYALSDSEEKEFNYDDSNWKLLPELVYLEDISLAKHGFLWYRAEFLSPGEIKDSKIIFDTGGIDRAYLYLNGEFLWKGVGKATIETFEKIREGKNVLAIRYENAYHTKGHPAEGPVNKKSGIGKPILVCGTQNGEEWKEEIRSLRVRLNLNGVIQGYQRNEFDDSKWIKVPQGEKYVCHKEMGDVIWFRQRFKFNKEKGWIAPLGICILEAAERLIIYFNGQLLGKYENIGPQHKFYIPESMLNEDNLIALILEGPGYNQFKPTEFKPPYLKEPVLETFYEAKEKKVEICR